MRSLPGASLALVSVPGAFAAAEARRALGQGLHVMLFSDNVSVSNKNEAVHCVHFFIVSFDDGENVG